MPRIKAASVAEHREHIYGLLLDAVESLVAERGVEAVSMRDIAERAGVTRTVVYNYAADKTALLLAAVDRTAQAMYAAMAEIADDGARSAPERLEAMVHLLLTSFLTSAQSLLLVRTLHTVLTEQQRHQAMSPFQNQVRARLLQVVTDGIERGAFRPVGEVALTADLMIGMLDAAVTGAIHDPATAEAAAAAVTQFYLRALTTGPAGS